MSVLLLPLLFVAAPADPPDVAGLRNLDVEALSEAQAAEDAGRPADALERLRRMNPKGLEDRVALLRGEALFALGETEAALKAYAEAEAEARLSSLRRRAQEGQAEVYGATGAHAERIRVFARLRPSDPDLRFRWADSLLAVDEKEEAQTLLMDLYLKRPRRWLDDAVRERLVDLNVTLSPAQRERRIEALLARRYTNRARTELARLKPSGRSKLWWDYRLADASGRAAAAALDALRKDDPKGEHGDEVLFQLGRAALGADDNERARDLFDELFQSFPKSQRSAEAEYLAGWIEYAGGRYLAARKRMSAYSSRRPKDRRVTEALWYAAWSSYLGEHWDEALADFDGLLKRHPRSDLVPFAWYWSARVHARRGQSEEATRAYQSANKAAPFSYYGFWARRRLRAMGVDAPEPKAKDSILRFDVPQILSALGPERPLTIDRAIEFSRIGRDAWAEEELKAGLDALGPPDSFRRQVMRADLCREVSGHRLAFKLALRMNAPARKAAEGDFWAWRTYQHRFPDAFSEAVRAASTEHRVSPELIWAVMRTESHYRPDVRSAAGAVGLMQLLPATARSIAGRVPEARPLTRNLRDPAANVWLGSWYLGQLAERFPGFLPAQIAAYNAGPTATQSWVDGLADEPTDEFVERISYRETRRYVRRVLETMWTYQVLYGQPLTLLSARAEVSPPKQNSVHF
ncbi:MAG: tetratricopeptide repeat protein [Myxococcota bacterium]